MGRKIKGNDEYAFSLHERITRDLVWDEMCYYDLETATWEELQKLEGRKTSDSEIGQFLNIRKTGITSFVVLIPEKLGKHRAEKKQITVLRPVFKTFCEKSGVEITPTVIKGVNFYYLSKYVDITEDGVKRKGEMLEALTGIMEQLQQILHRGGRSLYIAGYNNARFDDLIFDGYLEKERLTHRLYLYDHESGENVKSRISFVDLRGWANAYGCRKGLASVGAWLGVPKLDKSRITSKEAFMDYNRRDVEILPLFVERINSIHRQMGAACMDALTPASASRYFMASALKNHLQEKYRNGKPIMVEQYIPEPPFETIEDVDEHGRAYCRFSERWLKWAYEPRKLIEHSPHLYSDTRATRNFRLFGGRTEPFEAVAENPAYLDVNSLYPSVQASLLFPGIVPVGNDYKLKEDYIILEKNPDNIYRMDDEKQCIVPDYKARRECRERGETFLHPIAKSTYDLLRGKIREIFLEVAYEYKTITPEKLTGILSPLFLEGKLFYGTAKVRIDGINDNFKQREEGIKHHFPFPRRRDGFTLFSLEPGAIYDIQFYEIAYLAMFDFQFCCFQDTTYNPVQYRPEVYPLKDEVLSLYSIRQAEKKKAKDTSLDEQTRRTASGLELGVKIILNSGYGIMATKNHGRVQRVYSNSENEKLRQKRDLQKYISDPFYSDIADPERHAGIFYQWRKSGMMESFSYYEDGMWLEVKPVFGGQYFEVINLDDTALYASNTIPAWALATTSGARYTLNAYIINAGLADPSDGMRVYYCDTDSIMCSQTMAETLEADGCIDSAVLGKLKPEALDKGGVRRAYFLAPKTYLLAYNNGTVKAVFKGTGEAFERDDIVSQGLGVRFSVQSRIALDPDRPQKRKLVDGIFRATARPEMGTDELKERILVVRDILGSWEKRVKELTTAAKEVKIERVC